MLLCTYRYLMNTTKKCGISIQVTTSKQDALIRFEVSENHTRLHYNVHHGNHQVLDHEHSLVAVEGRGGCTIPLCFLVGERQPSSVAGECLCNYVGQFNHLL